MQRLQLALRGFAGLALFGLAAGCKPNAAERDPCATLNWYEPENGYVFLSEYEPNLEEVRLAMEEYNAVRGDVDFWPYEYLDGSYLALLEPLCEVDGNLSIVHLDAPDLSGLANLRRVSQRFMVGGTELETLETGGYLVQVRTVSVNGNAKLRSTEGVRVEADTTLLDRGADGPETGGALSIDYNPALTDLEMFSEVETARGELLLGWLPSLTDLSGFRSLRDAGELELTLRDTSVGSFAGLESVERLNLNVLEQPFALSGLPEGAEPTELTIAGDAGRGAGCSGDSGAIDLAGLPAGTKIGKLALWQMGVSSLQPLAFAYGVHDLSISDLNCLTTLDGLPEMAESFTVIEVYDMESLTDISGLRGARNGGYVKLDNLPLLTGVKGLTELEQVKSLVIDETPLLTDISGLSNLRVQDWRGLPPEDSGLLSLETGGTSLKFTAPIRSLAPLYGLTSGRHDVYTSAADPEAECALLAAAVEGREVGGTCQAWVPP